ncbi:MAG: PD-(D/E)XK nuclease family protein [Gammaproteobacteria bacterium]|nr:PD-(D/E)XK nuclease family protein [Gammaproteobacteria bacterium]MBU1775445.1 PD-(D/E)XK nuclease family protein [Gammaproteobacteria bacterium]MBU1968513.1 PD-(D/E)XK nuclease family protein [Gammaproteobacteria bacterium]
MNDTVLVTWQKDKDGEARLLSPFLQLLHDELTAASLLLPPCRGKAGMGVEAGVQNDSTPTLSLPLQGGGDEGELLALLELEDAQSVALPLATQPAPAVAAASVPASVSISGYNSLVACPYQFYARHILKLNELDEVPEAIEKRDYGERVHGILQRFHEQYPVVSGNDRIEMETALRRISEELFADLLAQDFAARAWLARWYKSLPAYLEWQTEAEVEGWRYAEAESKFDWQLEGVRLRGRIDRLDVRGDEKMVLDYKTQNEQLLRNKLKEPGEDVQLACYAYAHEAAVAAFVSIDDGKVKLITPKDDVPLLAQLNVERLENVMAEMRSGAGLPANGIDQACMHCEIRGVCRKGEW